MDDASYIGQGGCDEDRVFSSRFPPHPTTLLLTIGRFVSRTHPRAPDRHVILGVVSYAPQKFAEQMNLNLANGWGIVRTIIDMVRGMKEGKYVLVKDPNKSLLRLYEVPLGTFEEDEGEDEGIAGEEAGDEVEE